MGSGGGGARGGAAIYIKAPFIIVDGTIRMDGGDASRVGGIATKGGGAGGSIWIELSVSSQSQGFVNEKRSCTDILGWNDPGNGTLSVRGAAATTGRWRANFNYAGL